MSLILVSLRHVVQMPSVAISMDKQCARVCAISLESHLHVDQSVLAMRSVRCTWPASNNIAEIPVPELVALMPNAV